MIFGEILSASYPILEKVQGIRKGCGVISELANSTLVTVFGYFGRELKESRGTVNGIYSIII
jgi:hypothetical protein